MNEKFLRDTLFPIIRAGLNLPNSNLCGEIDYPLLIGVGMRQSILPIIKEGLNSLNIKGAGLEKIEKLCMGEMYRFLQRDTALERICQSLKKNGIEYILLKGAVLRDLYPDKWMRTSCDIDVLVKEEDLQRATDALEKETEFKCKSKNYHDILMKMPNVNLELHFNIKEDMDNVDKLLLRVWENCTREENSYQFVLTPEFQIFHIISHMSFHFVHGGLGIRPYIDLWLLRHKTEYNEQIVRDMCDKCGILKFYDECCALSEVWLGEKEHTDTSKMLERYSLNGGVFGNAKNAVITEQLKHKKAGYIFRRLFMDSDSLKRLYPILEKYPYLMPYCQLKRWKKALKSKRAEIKGEMKLVRNINDEEYKSFEKLMESVGFKNI